MGPGGPPMGAGPGGPPPIKRGTSKAVPVVVSAGLAVGVFCGLLFGVGTGQAADTPPPVKKDPFARSAADLPPEPPPPPPSTNPPPVKPNPPVATAAGSGSGSGSAGAGSGSGSATAVAAGSGSGSADVGAGSGSAVAAPEEVVAKLVIEIEPSAANEIAKILVDGKPIEGRTIDIPLGDDAKQAVKVAVSASGFKDTTQEVTVEGNTTMKFELVKRRTGGGLPRIPTGSGNPKKPPGGKKPGGGLIDI